MKEAHQFLLTLTLIALAISEAAAILIWSTP